MIWNDGHANCYVNIKSANRLYSYHEKEGPASAVRDGMSSATQLALVQPCLCIWLVQVTVRAI